MLHHFVSRITTENNVMDSVRCLNSEGKFPILLLVVECGQAADETKAEWHRGLATGLDDSHNSCAQQDDAVAQGQLGTPVLVLLQEIA